MTDATPPTPTQIARRPVALATALATAVPYRCWGCGRVVALATAIVLGQMQVSCKRCGRLNVIGLAMTPESARNSDQD